MKSATITNSLYHTLSKLRASALSKRVALFSAAMLTLLNWLGPTSHAAVANADAVPVEALQLATDYQQNTAAADTTYKGKTITVKGTVCKIEQGFGNSSQTLAWVYLKTSPGLPLIKLEVSNIEQVWKQAWGGGLGDAYGTDHPKVKITDSKTLEVMMVTSRTRKWLPIVKCGDMVIVTGVCKGRLIDIVIGDAAL